MKYCVAFFLLLSVLVCSGQDNSSADSLRTAYKAEMKAASNKFSQAYYPNKAVIYSLTESRFIKKMDSLQQLFLSVTNKYSAIFQKVDATFIPAEKKDIAYFFDRMLLDYPYFHEIHTGKVVQLSNASRLQLKQHEKDFNDPAMLASKDFQQYIQAFLRHQSTVELRKASYKKSDNKRLDASLNIIPRYFTNQQCREYWQYHYLLAHLDNWGSKNIAAAVRSFMATCQNTRYTHIIDSVYTESANAYKGHLIKTYKTVEGLTLDLHIFLPDTSYQYTKRPVMVYFSGGSWTEGTPEWDFYNCENYAKKGWVAVSVEYRVADRFETTPSEAVKDARSAIRWLRQHAGAYNIDTSRIVASGNSAGGHLVLATALSTEVNERSDNLRFSPVPNLLLVNGGVYNLFADESTDWISRRLKNKKAVTQLSPLQLLRKGIPPVLIIHGTNDQSVDFASAKVFAEQMKQLENELEFHALEGAPHYIWYDRRFSGKVSTIRKDFLKKYGYE